MTIARSDNEGIPASGWYLDADGDGFGDGNQMVYNCQQPVNYINIDGDCDDSINTINPLGIEVCNGLDDNCDGIADSGSLGSDAFCAASSCLEILNSNANAPDGDYFVQFDSGIQQTECDMGSFGGGWTQVYLDQMSPRILGGPYRPQVYAAYGVRSWGATTLYRVVHSAMSSQREVFHILNFGSKWTTLPLILGMIQTLYGDLISPMFSLMETIFGIPISTITSRFMAMSVDGGDPVIQKVPTILDIMYQQLKRVTFQRLI